MAGAVHTPSSVAAAHPAAEAARPGEGAHAVASGVHGPEAPARQEAAFHGAAEMRGPGMEHAADHGVRDVAHERAVAEVHDHDFHTRDVREFDRHEFARWHDGHWHNSWHDGRLGWWWQVDDVWYWYDRPVYPFPLVVAPLYSETVVEVTPVVALAPIAPLPAAPQVAYRCAAPDGFYPAVSACASGWQQVALTSR
jgi:hypothetical protein